MGGAQSQRKLTAELFKQQPISGPQADYIEYRYLRACDEYEARVRKWTALHMLTANAGIVLGLILGVLIVLRESAVIGAIAAARLFWVNLVVTALMTLITTWQSTFSVTEHYILARATQQKLHSEGWAFLSSTGAYAELDQLARAGYFAARIERILNESFAKRPDMSASKEATEVLAMAAKLTARNRAAANNTHSVNDTMQAILHSKPPRPGKEKEKITTRADSGSDSDDTTIDM